METHVSILPGKSPWTEEPEGYSPWGLSGHSGATKHSTAEGLGEILTTPILLEARH